MSVFAAAVPFFAQRFTNVFCRHALSLTEQKEYFNCFLTKKKIFILFNKFKCSNLCFLQYGKRIVILFFRFLVPFGVFSLAFSSLSPLFSPPEKGRCPPHTPVFCPFLLFLQKRNKKFTISQLTVLFKHFILKKVRSNDFEKSKLPALCRLQKELFL